MMRWILILECGHRLLSDDDTRGSEWCPGCGFSSSVVDSYQYLDEDIA